VAGALGELAADGVAEFFLQPPDPVGDGYLIGQHVLPLLRAADGGPQAAPDNARKATHVG